MGFSGLLWTTADLVWPAPWTVTAVSDAELELLIAATDGSVIPELRLNVRDEGRRVSSLFDCFLLNREKTELGRVVSWTGGVLTVVDGVRGWFQLGELENRPGDVVGGVTREREVAVSSLMVDIRTGLELKVV